jgi:hypothetical protein
LSRPGHWPLRRLVKPPSHPGGHPLQPAPERRELSRPATGPPLKRCSSQGPASLW